MCVYIKKQGGYDDVKQASKRICDRINKEW